MKPFLEEFFPSILRKSARAETNVYCVYDNQLFTLFTSSLHLAGLISSLLASRVTTTLGRRNTMIFGGCIFFAGGAINAAAQNIFMLILGRILLGFGVGFTNQVSIIFIINHILVILIFIRCFFIYAFIIKGLIRTFEFNSFSCYLVQLRH